MLCEYNWFIGRVLMEQHVSACWEAIIGFTVLALREKYLSFYKRQIFVRFTKDKYLPGLQGTHLSGLQYWLYETNICKV